MAGNLVIVESPAKAETIKKFLGKNYDVIASNGHIRNFPKSSLGIDVEHDFEPKYITIRGKGELLSTLRKAVKKADKVYLATDPDREGEAISWHLMEALKLDPKKTKRITFNEITKNAVKQSIKQAREIDMDLVNSQQARRMLDRLIGYKISPLLWAKVKRGLSAGRVQSVALRIICDREKEINSFIPSEYWNIDASFKVDGDKKPLVAHFYGTKDGKCTIDNKTRADEIINAVNSAEFEVKDIKLSERTKKSPVPFTTSTLQQEASKTLNYSTQKTMRIAQQLYEGVSIEGEGTIGLITYLRTDSTRIAAEADTAARAYIEKTYGEKYLTQAKKEEAAKGHIQDAHEGIRPTDITREPVRVKESLSRDQFRLYQLIWRRFTASRMADAVYMMNHVQLESGGYEFSAVSSKLSFDGFMSIYNDGEEKAASAPAVDHLSEGMELSVSEKETQQHFTQPPAHFTEATLVRMLEEKGIGRPSTYAPTITTILARHYITKEKKNLYVTELGQVVNNIMMKSFPIIVDAEFTANMESLLDMVGEGMVEWKSIVRNFYPDLHEAVEAANRELESVKIEDQLSDEFCELCGRQMVIKYGPHGKFLACPGFPDCRNTKPYLEKIGVACPKCGKDLVIRKTKKGRVYYGCEGAPDCDFMSWNRPTGHNCPKCGSYMIKKGNRECCSDAACGYIAKSEE